MNVTIEKISKGKFLLTWEDFPEEELNLDFNPFVKQYSLNSGVILHWQARPKSTKTKQGRCWGFYDVAKDVYFAGVASEIPQFKVNRCQLLDIPEHKLSSVPSAVVLFPSMTAHQSENLIFIE
ncbi:MAG: hypothetical protein RIM23_09955 [Coleofasciculus sp. G3-WIS-01]|uniref:hypothetical protein n=1 Tax=Coleofasciculus sp. G3-WIS-01 TaxID=3069528 RepID=UPI003305156C